MATVGLIASSAAIQSSLVKNPAKSSQTSTDKNVHQFVRWLHTADAHISIHDGTIYPRVGLRGDFWPYEVLVKVFSHLDAYSLAQASMVCGAND